MARNLVRIMHFSLHTEEICLHNICQQPEQFLSVWEHLEICCSLFFLLLALIIVTFLKSPGNQNVEGKRSGLSKG